MKSEHHNTVSHIEELGQAMASRNNSAAPVARFKAASTGGRLGLLLAVCLLAGVCGRAEAGPRLLYSQSFDAAAEPGVIGKAGKDFTINARGRIDMDRGTFAFFTRCDKDPVDGPDHALGGVDQQLEEGHYFQVMGFERWRTDFLLLFLDAGRYAPPLRLPPVMGRWKAGEWHHLAVVWDRNEGITVYEDGRRVGGNWGKYRWSFSLFPRNLFLRGVVDELRVYADCLTDVQVARLAKGENPDGEPIPVASPADRREHDLARMGWSGESLAALPVVDARQPQAFSFARVTGGMDAKWRTGAAFDGIPHTTWPQIYYGPSRKGQRLELTLAPGQVFDRVRALIQRPYNGELQRSDTDGALLPLEIPEAAVWHRRLHEPVRDERLVLTRRCGQLGEIAFYRVEPARKIPGQRNRVDYLLSPANAFPDSELGRILMTETPVRFQQPVAAATAPASSPVPWTLAAPAFGGFQAFTEAPTDARAFDGAIVTLVAEDLTEPTPVRVTIKEPVHSQKDWLVADAVLRPRGNGRQVFTIVLKGRPVINMPPTRVPAQIAKGRQPAVPAIEVPGVAFGMTVTAANPVNWAMGRGGSSLAFILADQETVLPLATDDQVEYMRQGFSTLVEGHAYGDPRIQVPLRWLARFAPGRREVEQIVRRTGLQPPLEGYTPSPSAGVPTLDTGGAPEWAVWQQQAMNKLLGMVNWRIENTQLDTGEYGATFNDDTDYVECWIDYALAIDDDQGTIKTSLRRFWDGLWKYSLDEGVGRYTTDSCHFAEEGLMSIAMRLLVDYGDPVSYERVMQAARHVDQWLVKTEKGYRFPSDWVGSDGLWAAGDWAQPGYAHRADLLVPAGYLIWHNQHPAAAAQVTGVLDEEEPGWRTRAPELNVAARGFVEWAGASLRDPDELRRQCADALIQGKAHGKKKVIYQDTVQWVAVAGVPEAWPPKKPEFSPGPPLPSYPAWAHTERQWFDWKLSGDTRFLVDACKRIVEWFNNFDYVITEAMPAADRIAEPREAVICARLGARAAHRGASGLPWPHHAISYERGAREIAALVTENLNDRLSVRFYAFTDQAHEVHARVWRLWPGDYKLRLAFDRNHDGVPEEMISETDISLGRGAPLTFTLPPRQGAILSLIPVRVEKPDFRRPDLAISRDTVDVVYNRHLVVKVHNLGSKAAENVLVRVRDAASGQVIPMGEQRIARIEPPLDFQPRSRSVQFDQIYATARGVIIEVDPDGQTGDPNPWNNRLVLDDSDIFGPTL